MTVSPDPNLWCGQQVPAGTDASLHLNLTESFTGHPITIPVHVWRARQPGPTVAITAAVHGDEINGTGAIRQILRTRPFELQAGTLVLVPVVNLLGFERHSRYLPDRRDLNRSFPGTRGGSLASRLAATFFKEIMLRCGYLIDLHTAAVRRTNFPNVRADMGNQRLAEFARAFGAELIISSKGPKGSLRYAACKAGCAALILEAGEVWKVEPTVVEYAIRGIQNCLRFLGMVPGKPTEPASRVETDTTKWVRATHGGFLEFHVAPGEIVQAEQPIATNTDLMGTQHNVIRAPRDGVVLGMTTIPSVAPGDPVCHLAFPRKRALKRMVGAVDRLGADTLFERLRSDLASNVAVTDHNGSDEQD